MSMAKDEIQIAFGKHLKKKRECLEISQREFELRGDLDRHTLSKIETGEVNPTVKSLLKICKALDITLEELFKGFNPEG